MKIFIILLTIFFSTFASAQSFPLLIKQQETSARPSTESIKLLIELRQETQQFNLAKQLFREYIQEQTLAILNNRPLQNDQNPIFLGEKQRKLLQKILQNQFKNIDQAFFDTKSFEEDLIKIYQEIYTQNEVNALNKFYQTPEGQSVAKKQSIVLTKYQELFQKRLASIPIDEDNSQLIKEIINSIFEDFNPLKIIFNRNL